MDLTPLKGMSLETLLCQNMAVTDLSPLTASDLSKDTISCVGE